MPYSIAFVGYDGSGKTTLLNHLRTILRAKYIHWNGLSRHFYRPNPPEIWEIFTYGEISLRNIWIKYLAHFTPLLLDRCYVCALVYSNLEGRPTLMHNITKRAFRPDIIVLMEPVEEMISGADRFVVEYQKVLSDEGYVCFDTKPYIFGSISFWKLPEIITTPIVGGYVELIGEVIWQPPSNSLSIHVSQASLKIKP